MTIVTHTFKTILSISMYFIIFSSFAQESHTELPYAKIPDNKTTFSSGNVIARMVDGLGFRYHWASKGLTATDLQFSPNTESRSTLETIRHIYNLSVAIANAPQNKPNDGSVDASAWDYEKLRKGTLQNLKIASDNLQNKTAVDIAKMKVIFKRGENISKFPYWNMINGQLSDAIYHTGQLVSFRRTSGNPMNPKVNVFNGTIGN